MSWTMIDSWTASANSQSKSRSVPWISVEQAMEATREPPPAAEARARQMLKANPNDPQAKALLAATHIRQGRWQDAQTILARLSETQPQLEFAWRGLGQTLVRTGERARAIQAFERSLDLEIRGKDAWFALGSLLAFTEAKSIGRQPTFAEIEEALMRGRLDVADKLSDSAIQSYPDNPAALKLRADTLIQRSRWREAKPLLARALQIAPDFLAARFRYATMLFAHSEFADCLREIDELLRLDCDTGLLRGARAVTLALSGDYARAIQEFDGFIRDRVAWPGLWHEYGRLLRTAGDRRMSDAFARAVEILPSYAAAHYALSTVKSFRWDEAQVDKVRAQLARPDLGIDDRALLHVVMGRALEDRQRYDEAFESFREGKRILRSISEYVPKASQTAWHKTRLLFNPAFVRNHARGGAAARDPIFIVGMPRAGSTLVEQIISSHSQVEALGELTTLPSLVERLYQKAGGPLRWPMLLKRFQTADFRALGEEYLQQTLTLRETGSPFFTDKQPNNFQLVGLIHLMLPDARIVDIRRHPLDCGFSCFKHYFPKGHPFSCDLSDIGRRYVDYVRLMAHFDEVLPGKVYRVIYENLVGNFEEEVRRLLAFLGLPFEPACLQFFENRRRVITLSFEQVFMPLYESGIGHWRRYESRLSALKDALGYVLEIYPDVPKFFPDVHATSRTPRSLGEASGRFGSMKGLTQRPFRSAVELPAA